MSKEIKFGKMVERYMRLNKLTMKELGKIVGRGESTVSMWIANKSTPPMGIVQKLADYFGITTDMMIYGEDDTIEDPQIKVNPSNVIEIPLYSSISCGTGLFVDDNIDDYIAVPNRFIKPNRKYFANYASGDSMIGKGILNGDVLVFEEAPVLDNGQIGAFCINDDEAVCKIFRKLSNGIILLESANSNYPPIEIDIMHDNCFRVIGKLVGSYKKF